MVIWLEGTICGADIEGRKYGTIVCGTGGYSCGYCGAIFGERWNEGNECQCCGAIYRQDSKWLKFLEKNDDKSTWHLCKDEMPHPWNDKVIGVNKAEEFAVGFIYKNNESRTGFYIEDEAGRLEIEAWRDVPGGYNKLLGIGRYK